MAHLKDLLVTGRASIIDKVYSPEFVGKLTGNADTATKLATARTIALTGSVTGSGTFDGSGNLSISTTTNHTHNYLPLSGGTVTGATTFNNTVTVKTLVLGTTPSTTVGALWYE